jgi:hypothetical protein
MCRTELLERLERFADDEELGPARALVREALAFPLTDDDAYLLVVTCREVLCGFIGVATLAQVVNSITSRPVCMAV